MIKFFDLNSEGITAGTELVREYLTKNSIGEKEKLKAALGIIVFGIFRPGDPALASSFIGAEVSVPDQSLNLSLKDIIVGIVPSNFIGPFVEADMLQLLFEAILCGIAAGMIGERSSILKEVFEACDELFLRITGIIMKVTPLAVFCSILSLVLKTGISSLMSLLGGYRNLPLRPALHDAGLFPDPFPWKTQSPVLF